MKQNLDVIFSYLCCCLAHFFVRRIKLQPKIEMHLLAPGTIVLKERYFSPWWQTFLTLSNIQLNLHVKKYVPCFFIIKDKINLSVEFSSNNNLKDFHANFTENRVRIVGNYFLPTSSPIRLNVHFGTELSVLISA